MLTAPRTCRRGECGQALAIALAFIAFFGLVVVAVFDYAGATTLQHGQTENAASIDATAEGAAIFAAQDARAAAAAAAHAGGVVGSPACAVGNSATLTMQTIPGHAGGDTLSYSMNQCNPAASAYQPLANECVLCLFGGTSLGMTSGHPITLSVNGPVGIAGAATLGGNTLQSISQPGFIGCVSISSCTGGTYLPIVQPISSVVDPFAGVPAPTLPGPCSPQPSRTTTFNPGDYCSFKLSANNSYTFNSGTYVITGLFQVIGNATIVTPASGVTFYFACTEYPTPCTSGETGGAFFDSGNGTLTLNPSDSGPNQGLSLMFDRNDVGVTTDCDTAPAHSTVCITGNGASIAGSVYSRAGQVSFGGNGTATVDGSVVAQELMFNNVSGTAGAPLTLTGKARAGALCWVYDVSGQGAQSGSTASIAGYAVGSAILSLSSGPTPSTGQTIILNGGTAETFVVESVNGSSVTLSAPIQRAGHTTANWYSASRAIIESACSGGQGGTDIVNVNYQR